MTEYVGRHSYRLWVVSVVTYLDVHLEHELSMSPGMSQRIAQRMGMVGGDVTDNTVYRTVILWAATPSVCILKCLFIAVPRSSYASESPHVVEQPRPLQRMAAQAAVPQLV